MIDNLVNLLFHCTHRHLTRPVTPVSKGGKPHGETYVVCLDCGKQFTYDLKEMRIGHAVDKSAHSGVLPPQMPVTRRTKMKYALWASALALALGAIFGPRKPRTPEDAQKDEGPR